MMHNVNNNQV